MIACMSLPLFPYTSIFELSPLSSNYPFFFFLTDPPPPEFSPLPLHAPLPISGAPAFGFPEPRRSERGAPDPLARAGSGEQPVAVEQGPFRECDGREDVQPEPLRLDARRGADRSEEHTSELQSRLHLVCRLLLE